MVAFMSFTNQVHQFASVLFTEHSWVCILGGQMMVMCKDGTADKRQEDRGLSALEH